MRGDLVTIALRGDFGKPRPAVVIQADQFDQHATITILPVTSTRVPAPLFRVAVQPNDANGLQRPSHVMVDKVTTVKRNKVGQSFGRIDSDLMLEVERCLAVFLGLAK